MTIKLAMILLGTLLIYGGWTNRDIQSLLFGDNTTQKKSSNWPASPTSATGQSASSPVGSSTGNPPTGGAAGSSSGEPSSASQANAAFGIGTGMVSAPTKNAQ